MTIEKAIINDYVIWLVHDSGECTFHGVYHIQKLDNYQSKRPKVHSKVLLCVIVKQNLPYVIEYSVEERLCASSFYMIFSNTDTYVNTQAMHETYDLENICKCVSSQNIQTNW